MKKNLVNKKVVSSIGIGIMAFVTATSSTLTVLAEENAEQPAQEPAPVVEANTSGSGNQGQTEQAPSEQSKAVDTAQIAVADAKAENPANNDTLSEINAALDGANEALGSIANDVAALDTANKDVNDANTALADGLVDEGEEKYGDEIEKVENAATTVEENVKDLTDEEIKEAAGSAVEKAGEAESARDKTHENVDAAKAAEQKVKDDLADVEEEDGVLDRVENAEDALTGVETQIEVLVGALDANKTAKENAENAEEEANGKLDVVLSEGMKNMTEEDKDKLGNKLQEVTNTQKTLAEALGDNRENIKGLVAKINNKDDIDEAEKEELIGIIERLERFDELNKYEQDKCLKGLEKFGSVVLDEESVADMVSEYMSAYTTALQKHVEALEELVSHMDTISESLTDNAKTALENAKTALEAAKKYEDDSLAAYNQVNEVMDAAVAVQEAQAALDASTNARKDELIKIENGDGEQQGQKKAVEAAYEVFGPIESLEKQIKDKKEVLDALNMVTDVSQYRAVSKEIEKLEKALKELKEKNPDANNDYYRAADDLAKTRIEYILLDEGATNIKIGDWESNQKDNNYVEVSYTVIGEDGQEYPRTEYFDYTHTGADVTVVRKEAISKAAKGHELGVTVVDGKPVYRYGDEEIPNEKVTITDNGYYIDGVTEPVTTYTFKPWLSSTKDNITFTMIEKLDESFIYTIKGGTVDGEDTVDADLVFKDKNGNVLWFTYKGNTYGAGKLIEGPVSEEPRKAFFENTNTFTDKGGRPVTEENYANKVAEYTENKANSEETLRVAIEALRQSVEKADGRLDVDTRTGAENYLKDETKDAEAIGNVVTTATTANTAASNTWSTSKVVKDSVDNAYLGIANAIKSLLNAQANKADTESYDRVKAAVDAHNEAANLLKKDDFTTLKGAAETLRKIAGESFRYNTPSTTPGGTTPGGTTGGTTGGGTGGTTGGGAGGTTGGGTGGAGGGAADAAVPAAAPVVTIPTTAVPLAGPAVADAEEAEDGAAGLTTLEDEVTPLAGPEKKEDAAGLANFPIPDINIAAEARQMSWLWLLIVALLGATGIEMYRRHQKKQQEEANIEN